MVSFGNLCGGDEITKIFQKKKPHPAVKSNCMVLNAPVVLYVQIKCSKGNNSIILILVAKQYGRLQRFSV